jgi:Tfp pilus assembly protein PilO
MRKNFNLLTARALELSARIGAQRGPGAWLRMGAVALGLLNVIGLFLYWMPPGGSRSDLAEESGQLHTQVLNTRANSLRLKTVAAKVQTGSKESAEFESKYFLPRRVAYRTILAELQRMAAASGLQEKDRVYTAEPIEGTADLTVLNITANYEGGYADMVKFLYEVDKSQVLLMLDTLSAAPQQAMGRLNAQLRFQAVIREDGSGVTGGQP